MDREDSYAALETIPVGAECQAPTSPLRVGAYRRLWINHAISNLGSQVQLVGATWLMAHLTKSVQMIALVQTALNLPTVIFLVVGGALADTFNRRRVMLVGQTAMLLSASALALLSAAGTLNPWMLLVLVFATQSFASLNNPSWQASAGDILPRGLISRAVALNSMSISLARTAGPALGGVIVTVLGVTAAFVANAATFIGFIAVLARWHPGVSVHTTRGEPMHAAMVAGIRYALVTHDVRNAMVRGGLAGLFASAVFALLPVLAQQRLSANAFGYGSLLASFGAGAVVAAYAGGQVRAWRTPDQVIAAAMVLMAASLAMCAVADRIEFAALGAALGGAGWTLTHSTFNATVQLAAASPFTARSLALYQTATFAGMAVGSATFGWAAEHYGLFLAFIIAAIGEGLAGLIALAMPLPRLEELVAERVIG